MHDIKISFLIINLRFLRDKMFQKTPLYFPGEDNNILIVELTCKIFSGFEDIPLRELLESGLARHKKHGLVLEK